MAIFVRVSRLRRVNVAVSANNESYGNVFGNQRIARGRQATVTAVPASSIYKFDNWTVGGTVVSTAASYQFNAPIDGMILVANFSANTVTINVAATTKPNAFAGNTVSGGGVVAIGSPVTLTAATTDSTNYQFAGWYENNTLVSSNIAYTFTAFTNRNIEARFGGKITITLNNRGTNNIIIVLMNSQGANLTYLDYGVAQGSIQVFALTPLVLRYYIRTGGAVFVSWSLNGFNGPVLGTINYFSFVPQEDMSIYAVFTNY